MEVPKEQYTYTYTPKNEFWETVVKRFAPMAPKELKICVFNGEMQTLVQNYANEYPEEMMGLLEDYLKFKEEIWKTDTGGSFTDTANYTDIIRMYELILWVLQCSHSKRVSRLCVFRSFPRRSNRYPLGRITHYGRSR